MATLLLSRPFLFTTTCASVGVGIGLSLLQPSSPFRVAPVQCQYATQASPETSWTLPSPSAADKPGQTIRTGRSGILTASNMRQISLGSVLGLAAGLGLRIFSKALVFFLGVGIVLVEWAASRGYNVIPVERLQRYVKGVDLRRAVHDNMAFKASFGATMAMAAFATF